VDALKSLHKTQDHKGIVRLIKRAMNIEDVTFQVFWVPPGAAKEGEHKDSPAWVELYVVRTFRTLVWQFKRVSGSSGLKVQAAIAC
jgi:hypothetical protein